MLAALPFDLESRLVGIMLGLAAGAFATWALTRWRLSQARQDVQRGDALETLVIEQQVVERGAAADGRPVPARLRLRYLGQCLLADVVPNAHLAAELRNRARRVSERGSLISMEGADGTFLLETLCGFVCDRTAGAPFPRRLYVMA